MTPEIQRMLIEYAKLHFQLQLAIEEIAALKKQLEAAKPKEN